MTLVLVVALLSAILVGAVAIVDDDARSEAARDAAATTAAVAASTGSSAEATPATPTETETAAGSPAEPTPTTSPPLGVVAGTTLRKLNKREVRKQEVRTALARARVVAKRSFSLRIGTFNVLGSQHTAPGGDRRAYPPASVRNGGAIGLIRSHGVDILGTQELQGDQLDALTGGTGMAAYPGYAFGSVETDNSILYDPDKFEFVSGTSFSITFMNSVRPQTVLRLRDRATGREFYVLNMHASAGGGKYAVSRRAGHLTAVSYINGLKSEGLPIFLTGDMNDRVEFFCRVMPPTGMVAAIGGSTSGGCRPAGALAVDWVTATSDVDFSGYSEDRSPLGRISDHHFVSADATVGPGDPVIPDDAGDEGAE